MHSFCKGALLFLTLLALSACNISLKQASPILSFKTEESENIDGEAGISSVIQGNAAHDIEQLKTLYFSDVINSVKDADDPSSTAEILSGLLFRSDRVCKQYLFGLVELRNTYKITNKALDSLPTIVSVFNLPGSELITATRINSIKDGVASSLTDIGLDDTAFLNDIREIQSIRRKMRNSILKALDVNVKAGYVGYEVLEKGDATKNLKVYSIFSALADLETYHDACSLFEKIYFDFKESDKLSELYAYRNLPDGQRLNIAEKN
jgi:hypothetical protein